MNITGTACVVATGHEEKGEGGEISGIFVGISTVDNVTKIVRWSSFGIGPDINTTVAIGKWVHVLGMVTDSKFEFYINGILIDSISKDLLYSYTDLLTIGALKYNPQWSRFFQGYISSVRIYNRSLNNYEIKMLSHEFSI